RQHEIVVAGVGDGGGDVRRPGATHDQGRTAVDQSVANQAGRVVLGVAGPQYRAADTGDQLSNGRVVDGQRASAGKVLCRHQDAPSYVVSFRRDAGRRGPSPALSRGAARSDPDARHRQPQGEFAQLLEDVKVANLLARHDRIGPAKRLDLLG